MTDWKRWVREHLDLAELDDAHATGVVEEIATLLQDHYEYLCSSGIDPARAEVQAKAQIDDWESLRDGVIGARRSRRKPASQRLAERAESAAVNGSPRWNPLAGVLRDFAFVFRSLRLSPGASLIMILTLAIGIGATTAIYSVVEAVVLRPLPYPEASRLGLITFTGQGLDDTIAITPSNAIDFREQSRSLAGIGTWASFTNTLVLEDGSESFVPIAVVEPQLLPMLGIATTRGRLLQARAGEDEGPEEALISEELWQRQFGSDPDVLGREIGVVGGRAVVVGVVAAGARFLVHPEGERERIDVWLPRAPDERRGNVFNRRALVRLNPEFTFAQATEELNAIAERNRERDFGNQDGVGSYAVVPLRDRLVKEVRPTLLLLLGAVGFVLLLVCVNVANLLLARSLGRRHEWALRSALGASRGRIVRLGLAESLVLAALGGSVGMALAAAGLRILPALLPESLPREADIGLSAPLLLFAGVLSLLTALLFGLVPAWSASRNAPDEALRESGRTATARGGLLSRALVTAQFALALVLVVGAGLMLRSVINLHRIDVGFEVDGLLTFEVLMPQEMFQQPESRLQFYREATQRLEALPGVESASWTNIVPLSGGFNTASWAHDEESIERFGELTAYFRRAMPGYFRTMGLPILAGRDFHADDVDNDRYVLIVSERMARIAWPGQSAIGKRVTIDFQTASGMTELRETEVVGVVPSSREVTLHGDEPPTAYLPAWSTRAVNRAVVRTGGEPTELVPQVRELVREMGILRPLDNVRAVRSNITDATEDTRFVLTMTALFAGVAVLLAALGVYGVVSQLVASRRREIGIRMALGASKRAVRLMVLRQGLLVVAAGTLLGSASSMWLNRLIASRLYGVSVADPVTFGLVAAILLAVAALACLIPARRATRVEPVLALRQE